MSTYTPHGSQISSGFPFDRLPLEIRHMIYDKLLPEAFIFQATRRGRHSQWPKNPLADLAMCLPQLQNEFNIRMYSSTRFIFYDSGYTSNRSVRTHGYETAANFFSCIGSKNLGYIKQVYCHCQWIESSKTLPHLRHILSLMASTDPERKIKELHLRFEKTNYVVPVKGARPIPRRCFVLHGFPGLELILIFPNSKDQVTEADLNAGIAQFRDPGPPVNFLRTLPAELRNKIFLYLIPSVYSCDPTRPRSRRPTPGWVVVNRQMNEEVCWVLYRECRFEFCIPSTLLHHVPQVPTPKFCEFIKRIGRKNARQIRIVTVSFEIYPYPGAPARCPEIPFIAGILRDINQKCGFQIDASSVKDPLVSEESEFQFRIPTRVGRTLIVMIVLTWPLLVIPEPYVTLESWAGSILKTSLVGI